MDLLELLFSGLTALSEYLSGHVIACLVPAFFIAGAVAVFISAPAVLKYFGTKANKFLSYGVASVSGTILAVCSCTVLPLFGAIYKRGAGLGPAVTFLYAAPAINILAIIYSARLLGYELGIARAIGAIVFSIVIGLIMAWLYRKEKAGKEAGEPVLPEEGDQNIETRKTMLLLSTLVGILVFAASGNWLVTVAMLAALVAILWRWFNLEEIKHWMRETLHFVRLIAPWLLVGVFAAGVIKAIVPESVIVSSVGSNSIGANFLASFLGALMYFATLTEVPIIKAFTELGMDSGPALALLLAGPALSLPNLLVIRSIMGTRKALTYAGLVVVFATFTGLAFGYLAT